MKPSSEPIMGSWCNFQVPSAQADPVTQEVADDGEVAAAQEEHAFAAPEPHQEKRPEKANIYIFILYQNNCNCGCCGEYRSRRAHNHSILISLLRPHAPHTQATKMICCKCKEAYEQLNRGCCPSCNSKRVLLSQMFGGWPRHKKDW